MKKEYPHFLASEIENSAPEKAKFHIIPVPFEHSVSYGTGTAKGPMALLEASEQLELYDAYTNSYPASKGIHTKAPIKAKKPEKMVEQLEKSTKESIEHKAIPIIIGGEHSVSFGAFKALKEKYGSFGIIHIDAHADLRHAYEDSIYSHASVMKRAIELDLVLAQFGTRAYCQEEKEIRKKHNITAYDAHEFMNPASFIPSSCKKAFDILPKDFPKNVYISFDVDGLDPSIIPHTGTPVPGGLQWYQSLELIKHCVKGRKIIGFDVVELAPTKNSQVSDFASANLVYKIMGLC